MNNKPKIIRGCTVPNSIGFVEGLIPRLIKSFEVGILSSPGEYWKACDLFRTEREIFREELEKILYLRVIPSQANYFLCEVTDKKIARNLANRLLSEYDILIKVQSTVFRRIGIIYVSQYVTELMIPD